MRRVLQSGLKGEELLAIIGLTDLQLAVALDQIGGQLLQPADLKLAKIKSRAAIDGDAQACRRLFGVDLGTAGDDTCGGIALRSNGIEQVLLGGIPVTLAKGLARRQRPACPQQLKVG